MKSVAIVDVQGFKTEDNRFILKEIAILCGEQVQVYLVQPPFSFNNLTIAERKQVRWIEKNRKLNWHDGFIPYEKVFEYINEFFIDKVIYCKGVEKVKWIQDIVMSDNVINLETINCPKLLSLYEEYRFCSDIYNCIYHSNICALRNVLCLRKWCTNNKILL